MAEAKSANGREAGILDALKLLFECDPECSALRPDYPALPRFFFTIDGQLKNIRNAEGACDGYAGAV